MEEIETAILGLLRRKNYYTRYCDVISDRYFSSDYTRLAYQYIKVFFSKYPDKQMVSKRNLRLMIDVTGEDRRLLVEVISNLTHRDNDIPIIEDKIREFVKHGIARAVIRDQLPALEGKKQFDIDVMLNELQVAKDFDIIGQSIYDYTEETESLHRTFASSGEPIDTMISELDAILHYAPTTKEEWIIVGPPGRGKTQWLLNMVVNAAVQGKTALYITAGDQGRLQIQSRIDSLVSGIPYSRLRDPTTRVYGLLRKQLRTRITANGGRILIQDWSETSCTPRQVEGLIQILNEEVDIMAIDYPDIMNPNQRYHERRHEIASIFGDMRKLAVKYDMLVWAGSQANRNALDKKVVTMKDVAEDIQKCWVADGILTYCQTPEEKEEDMGRIFIAKARRPPLKKYEIPVIIDPETGGIE